eukprot:GFYU01017751.1.p1 GENE.GFYU01017751.1~~GFYU01017751.1.p1  ORF type:complete len:138 (+),score=35.62 GFYU01017751.1:204-617(+)
MILGVVLFALPVVAICFLIFPETDAIICTVILGLVLLWAGKNSSAYDMLYHTSLDIATKREFLKAVFDLERDDKGIVPDGCPTTAEMFLMENTKETSGGGKVWKCILACLGGGNKHASDDELDALRAEAEAIYNKTS